ncbi:MAG: DUF642 domain-containing protein [Rubrivivax sp.]|nr:DUF642 domain-containing protein [Rubrivivax sp.]
MKTLASLAFAATLAVSAGSAGAVTNLLSDGDFESFDSMVANGAYTKINAGSLGAWTVGGTSVDLIQNAYSAITNVSVDLAGSPGPGSLSQSFMAVAGYVYTLTFDLANNGGTQFQVTFGGTTTSFVPSNPAVTHVLTWTALAAGSQLVKFESVAGGNSGPVLDNVILTAVPEPETYAMLLAGLAVVGFVARRRKL